MKIFIAAGEASGDYLGAELIENIKQLRPDAEFFGVGGDLMKNAGLKTLFGIEELSIMGLYEIIGKILHVRKLINKTVQAIAEYDPDVIVTIDSSGFTHRVDKKIKKMQLRAKIVHYVAPPVWAWRKWRADDMHEFIDKLLTLFPFEPEIFEKRGLPSVFVGHPVARDPDFLRPMADKIIHFKKIYCRDADFKKIVLLPGSRMAEIERHLPILERFTQLMADQYKKVVFFMPTIPALKEELEKRTRNWSFKPVITIEKSEKVLALYCSDAAVVASGTVTLEAARTELPQVIIYKTSVVTALIVKFLLHTKFVGLVNILAEERVVPELLQKDCTAENIFANIRELLDPKNPKANIQRKAFRKIIERISIPDKFSAAKEVLKCIS